MNRPAATPEKRWMRMWEVFHEARGLDSEQRESFLSDACAGDDALLVEVQELLSAHERSGGFLKPTEMEPVAPEGASSDIEPTDLLDTRPARQLTSGQRIGRYIIREILGEGGFAVVYLAEQTEPVRRRVALKVIKLGMDTKQVIARFEAERQALAMMDHPCVAKVFDAGVSNDGRPYFVMEHVPGVPITEHCDRQRLSINQRLALFTQVCDAVQHAHQKGIIHRDLKPSNILVSAKEGIAVPKVIDFGVAKALHQKLTEKTLFTEQGQLIGTPEYMSPEQAEMTAQDIDTRSDIYSLGVLLYELLTGALPFDPRSLRKAAFAEIQRIIRQEVPPKPSTKLSSLGDASPTNADNRRLDPRSLMRELRGDLDWIVMKALEKDRKDRYETANGFASDIRRHLAHEPVLAGPPSTLYRAVKFVRRNRRGVVVASIVILGLGIGVAIAGGALARTHEAKAHAAESEATLNAAVDVIDGILRAFSPQQVGRQADATVILDQASTEIARALGDKPIIRAAFERRIAQAYWSLGRQGDSYPHFYAAFELYSEALGTDELRTLLAASGVSDAGYHIGRFAECEAIARQALNSASHSLEQTSFVTRRLARSLAVCLSLQGQHEEALTLLRQTMDMEAQYRITDQDSLRTREYLAESLLELGQADEALALLVDVVRDAENDPKLGHENLWTMEWIDSLARVQRRLCKLDRAMDGHKEAYRLRLKWLGPDDVETLRSRAGIAQVHRDRGEYEDANEIWVEIIEIAEGLGSSGNEFYLANHRRDFADLLVNQKRYSEAQRLLEDSYTVLHDMAGDSGPRTRRTIRSLVDLYTAWHEAEPDKGYDARATVWRAKLPEPADDAAPDS